MSKTSSGARGGWRVGGVSSSSPSELRGGMGGAGLLGGGRTSFSSSSIWTGRNPARGRGRGGEGGGGEGERGRGGEGERGRGRRVRGGEGERGRGGEGERGDCTCVIGTQECI